MEQNDYTWKYAPYHKKPQSHKVVLYFGDTVRQLFLACGVIMLAGLPFFHTYIRISNFVLILGIVIVAIFAGLTNPKKKIFLFFDILISIIGTFAFEGIAIASFFVSNWYFTFNQIIAILFFIALYFAVKSYRSIANL
jgi:hypothetical protein